MQKNLDHNLSKSEDKNVNGLSSNKTNILFISKSKLVFIYLFIYLFYFLDSFGNEQVIDKVDEENMTCSVSQDFFPSTCMQSDGLIRVY